MNAHNEALARDSLKMTDTQRDIFASLTDDIVFTYPRWGTARGKEELGKFYQDIGAYVQAISHDPDTFNCLSNNGCVFIEGRSFGQLVDGASWPATGVSGDRFCQFLQIPRRLNSELCVYIDPDYADQTAEFYPWTPIEK